MFSTLWKLCYLYNKLEMMYIAFLLEIAKPSREKLKKNNDTPHFGMCSWKQSLWRRNFVNDINSKPLHNFHILHVIWLESLLQISFKSRILSQERFSHYAELRRNTLIVLLQTFLKWSLLKFIRFLCSFLIGLIYL